MAAPHSLFWIIAYPRESHEGSLATRDKRISEYTQEFPFQVPELRVGTLDSLLSLSDELVRVDQYVENVVQKIARVQQDFVITSGEKDASKIRQAVEHMATVNGMPFESCLCKFAWDDAKYPTRSTLKDIVSSIHIASGKIEEELKVKSSEYSSAKGALTQLERKAGGNILTRSLEDIITAEHVLPETSDSESLQTMFVVVANMDVESFFRDYETLMLKPDATPAGQAPDETAPPITMDPRKMCVWVVPRSARVITKDNEYTLVGVIVFKKMADSFKRKCRENTPKYTVRDFKFETQGADNSKQEKTKLVVECDKMKSDLQRWCRVNFGEAYLAWLHLKAVRVFVESVLRYGLPVNFQSRLLKLQAKQDKKVRDTLKDVFKSLGQSKHFQNDKEENPMAGAGQQDFYPYVYLGVNQVWTID